MRITKKHLENAFSGYVYHLKLLGLNVDGMRLDNYPLFGGYKIVSESNAGGSRDIFGSRRLSTREMYYALTMASGTIAHIFDNKLAA